MANEVFLEGGPGRCILFDGYRVTHKALVNSTSTHLSVQAIFAPKVPIPIKKIATKVKIVAVSAYNVSQQAEKILSEGYSRNAGRPLAAVNI